MMARNKARWMMASFLVATLALAGAGVAYSHWQQNLYIGSSVDTGTVTVGFSKLSCTEGHYDEHGIYHIGEIGGKDVGKVTANYTDLITDPITGKSGYKGIIVNITNAYPCYVVNLTVFVHNLGTVPVKVTGINITDPTGELIWDPGMSALKDATTGKPIIKVTITNLVGEQIDPCEENAVDFEFHFKQDAEQEKTYRFLITIEAVQWM